MKFLVNSSAISASQTAVISSPLSISAFIFKLSPNVSFVLFLALANADFVDLSSASEKLTIASVLPMLSTICARFFTRTPRPLPSAWITASLCFLFEISLNSFSSANLMSSSSLCSVRRLLNHLSCDFLFCTHEMSSLSSLNFTTPLAVFGARSIKFILISSGRVGRLRWILRFSSSFLEDSLYPSYLTAA